MQGKSTYTAADDLRREDVRKAVSFLGKGKRLRLDIIENGGFGEIRVQL